METINTPNLYDAFKEMVTHYKDGNWRYSSMIPCRTLYVCGTDLFTKGIRLSMNKFYFCCMESRVFVTDRPNLGMMNDIGIWRPDEKACVPNTYKGINILLRQLMRGQVLKADNAFPWPYDTLAHEMIHGDLTVPNLIVTESLYGAHKKYIDHVKDLIPKLDGGEKYRYDVADAALYLTLYSRFHGNTFSLKTLSYKNLFDRKRHKEPFWQFICDVYDVLQFQPTVFMDIDTILAKYITL